MRFFAFFKRPDIHPGIKEYENTSGAVRLDVRTPQEYQKGHIPGSKNVPLQTIEIKGVSSVAAHKDVPLFVYCHAGARSRQVTSDCIAWAIPMSITSAASPHIRGAWRYL